MAMTLLLIDDTITQGQIKSEEVMNLEQNNFEDTMNEIL